ncbi:MAG TPA: serine/threonine-protein kinase [Candidatus Acidoferrales bacterium]|jgi:serine/threonine protein kinase|nr:serine/threonine-protein kinase [Candidatus Acidoferrales bacterium]
MAEPTNPGRESSGASKPATGAGQRDTVLLGDVPESWAPSPETPSHASSLPHLSSAALAALSQRYEILGAAGHGSMGNVYKARDQETGEVVALKLLKPEIASDQAMMDRFKNELLFARKITHKNVCRVHEFNRLGGIAYTSMEFVEGESLRSALNRVGSFPFRKTLDLVLQICSGLKEAHAQGIVHRDLKPENIMIDAQGNVKIMDFGIARSMEAVTKLTGSMVGTPAYMAPEQVGGKPVDYRTDIYSLGLILYEMFTGTAAFRADNAVAVALKQMRESPVPPHEIDPQIPVGIERAILKCLEKEPGKRFQSISELENALQSQRATSTTMLAAAAPAAIASASAGRGTASGTGTTGIPRPATSPRKRMSPVLWATLAVAAVLFVLGGARSAKIRRAATAMPPPKPLPAPKPPNFAFEIPPRAILPPPAVSAPAPKPNRAPAKPEKHATSKPNGAAAPSQDVQQRSDKASSETPRGKAAWGSKAFIWVGRFDRQDRADAAAKKIHDLGGFQAHVGPRWGANGKFFIVWAGPFANGAVPDNLDWLHAQGFAGAREFKLPTFDITGRGSQRRRAGQGPDPDQTPNP